MLYIERSGHKVIKLFSCSTQLSMLLSLLIVIKIVRVNVVFMFNFKPSKLVIYMYLANNSWHFNIYEQDKFHAQLS